MKKRKIFLGVLLAAAAISMTACDGPDPEEDANKSSDTGDNGGNEQPSGGDVVVTKFTVTFNSNGGSAVASQEVEQGGKVTQPTAPTKAEDANYTYTFAGWYKDSSFNSAFNFATDTISSATTLYAKWTATAKPVTPTKFTVTFNSNGGSTVASQEVEEGGKVTQPAAPTKESTAEYDYTFEGWYKEAALQNEFDFANDTITSATTLYAKWNAISKGEGPQQDTKFTVTFNSNGGSEVASQEIVEGGKATRPADPTKEATADETYTFAGWYKDENLSQAFDFDVDTITSATTLYAKWTATPIAPVVVKYNVVFVMDGGSAVPKQEVVSGECAVKPADPTKEADENGVYKFVGWYKDMAKTEEFDFSAPITATTPVYAKWEQYKTISTAEEFNNFRKLEAADGNYMLTADIDLEGITLDATKVVFAGKFDGNGYSIKNALYTVNSLNKSGMLVRELRGGSITNVKFLNCISEHSGETIGIISGLASGNVDVSKIEFNGCTVKSTTYSGLIIGRIDAAYTVVNISEITCKNGCKVTGGSYCGTLISDTDKAEADKHTVINISNCDLSIELVGANKNGGFLSGRLRKNTDLNIKDVIIRSAIIEQNASGSAGLICGGGDNNATESNVTVENLYVISTNSTLLQSCALQTGSNPVTSFHITYTNCYMASDIISNITDNTINGVTYLQSVDKANANVNWLNETLKLDFENVWQVEEQDATKYRLVASSTNVKSPDAVIERLKLTTASAQVRFEQGTDFSFEGLSVTGIYSDGVNLVLTNGVEFEVISTNYNKDVAGQYTITVKSKEDETITATYVVEVVSLVSYDVDTEFTKITYLPGEELNIKGLLVYGTWTDGETLLFKKYTTNAESIDLSTAGVKELIISVEGFASKTVQISVVPTTPIITNNYTYINVDASASIDFGGQKVNGVETFKTINEAVEYLASVKLDASVNKVIYIADGIYHEKITIPSSLANLKIIGESRNGTIIEYDAVEDTVDPVTGTKYVLNCATLHVNAEGFGLENITVKNTFDYINDNKKYGNPQGLALTIAGDGAVLNEVTLYGNQDTLYFKKGRVYIKDSEIDGNIDFIFGENDGIAFFDNCTIKAINKSTTQENNNGYVTAMKGDPKTHPTYGYVFDHCNFTDDGTLKEGSMSLGRPWGAGATVTMISCTFSAAYSKLAYDGSAKSRWFDMSGNKPGNAFFAEYDSHGDGAIDTAVAGGSILTEAQAANYTAANTFAKENGGVSWSTAFDYLTAYNALVAAKTKVAATGILAYLDGNAIDDSMTIAADDTSNLILTSTEWNAENKAVEVSIADPTLATYADGKITGLATGSTTVTFTLGEVTKTVSLEVITLPSYEIIFLVPEGASTVASQSVKKNKKVEVPTAPTLEGSVFKGWFTLGDDEEYDFNTPVTGELALYARFVAWADMYKENIVMYFNGTEGDGVDVFKYDNTDQTAATYYGLTVSGKFIFRPANNDTQFNNGVEVSFNVEKYATIILTQKDAFAVTCTFNGVEVTPIIDGKNVIYETSEAGVFKIKNTAGGNKYVTSLSVTYPEVIKENIRIDFGSDGNYLDVTALDQSAANYGQIQSACNQIKEGGKLVFFVEAGAIIHISGNWSVGYNINGTDVKTTNAGGADNSGLEYSYTCTEGGKVTITSISNNNYFYYISVTYPKVEVIDTNTRIDFGSDGNYTSVTALNDIDANYGQIQSACNQIREGGVLEMYVNAGAKIHISGNWSVGYTINGTEVKTTNAGGADNSGLEYDYTCTEGGKVTITSISNNNYFYYISVSYDE